MVDRIAFTKSGLTASDKGQLVKYTDYAALEQERDALLKRAEDLEDVIRDEGFVCDKCKRGFLDMAQWGAGTEDGENNLCVKCLDCEDPAVKRKTFR